MKLFCQTFSKTDPTPPEKPLHLKSQSRSCFWKSRSPAKHTRSKIHMYSEFRSCMHYSLICSSLALLAMDRSMHDSSVRPPGMLPTCMLLGGSKNTWMHACMCMGRINNKWPCTGLHEIHPRPQQPGTVRTLLLVMIM